MRDLMCDSVSLQVRSAEFVNTQLREHYWSRFSKQNYFDERGVFAVVMFTGPLICLALVQLVSQRYLAVAPALGSRMGLKPNSLPCCVLVLRTAVHLCVRYSGYASAGQEGRAAREEQAHQERAVTGRVIITLHLRKE